MDNFDILSLSLPVVIIMRGIPGSGKSTFVKRIVDAAEKNEISVCVCSADDHFLKNGTYIFNARQLGAAHDACQKKFTQALENMTSIVIIDNSNTMRREYEKYVKQAHAANYDVKIKEFVPSNDDIIACFKRCVHNVPLRKLEEMANRWHVEQSLNKL